MMTKECLLKNAQFAEALGLETKIIPDVVSFIYDGIMDDDTKRWTDEQYMNWVNEGLNKFLDVPEDKLRQIYDNMSQVMGEVGQKYLTDKSPFSELN